MYSIWLIDQTDVASYVTKWIRPACLVKIEPWPIDQ